MRASKSFQDQQLRCGSYLETFALLEVGSGKHRGETQMLCLNFDSSPASPRVLLGAGVSLRCPGTSPLGNTHTLPGGPVCLGVPAPLTTGPCLGTPLFPGDPGVWVLCSAAIAWWWVPLLLGLAPGIPGNPGVQAGRPSLCQHPRSLGCTPACSAFGTPFSRHGSAVTLLELLPRTPDISTAWRPLSRLLCHSPLSLWVRHGTQGHPTHQGPSS